MLLKEVTKKRFTPKQVVEIMQGEGYPAFTQHYHTQLWKSLDAKDPAKGFGCAGDYKGTWVWFDAWAARVRAHCQEQGDKYK